MAGRAEAPWGVRLSYPEGWLDLPRDQEPAAWARTRAPELAWPGSTPADRQRLEEDLAFYTKQSQAEPMLASLVYLGEARDYVHAYLRARQMPLPRLLPPSTRRFARQFRRDFPSLMAEFEVTLVDLPCGPAVRSWHITTESDGHAEESVNFVVRPPNIRDAVDLDLRWRIAQEPAPMRASYAMVADEIARGMTIDVFG